MNVTFSSTARDPVIGVRSLMSGKSRYEAVATGLNFVWSFPNPFLQCASNSMRWPEEAKMNIEEKRLPLDE